MDHVDEVISRFNSIKAKIAVVRSDLQRDPERAIQSIFVGHDRDVRQLGLLQDQRLNAAELIAGYRQQILDLQAEHKNLLERDAIVKLMKLAQDIKDVNAEDPADRKRKKKRKKKSTTRQVGKFAKLLDTKLSGDRLRELPAMIRAFELAIHRAERAQAGDFLEHEADILARMAKRQKDLDTFNYHREHGWEIIRELNAELVALRPTVEAARRFGEIDMLMRAIEQAAELEVELSENQTALEWARSFKAADDDTFDDFDFDN